MPSTTLDIEDHAQLLAYLRATERIGSGETPVLRTLGGGVSNRAVRVDRATGEGWVMKQALAKLRVKVDWFSDPARIEREAMALRVLPTLVWPGAVTPLVFEDRDEHILAMQAVAEPHENWKTLLLRGEVDSDLVTQFGRLLGTIHSNARKRSGELSPLFADRRFFETLRVEPYYTYTATQVPAAATFIGKLVCESDARASARAARPRGDPLGRPRVRRRLCADTSAEQGALLARASRYVRGDGADVLGGVSAVHGHGAVGGRPG
jgi:hypothetical protein